MARRKQSLPEPAPEQQSAAAGLTGSYTVVARRYRPQQFAEVVGQQPVAQALINALESGRVAHAYLLTGARGVGKTSTARILAKAINCVKGPTPTPCDQCDICKSIAAGEDIDVIEIDGASNRQIDDVRAIRQNVQFKPQRARCKIYIIDEVHMLTKEAFNALLKTLEEPPPHVKFIFATTDVHKVPVTILSRCQRFDFVGISTPAIVDRLQQIVVQEKHQADDEALELIARRAGGSMRDAQSLLDQLLAFGDGKLTVDQVHRLLGTAPDDRVMELASAVIDRDPKRALALLDELAGQGLQLGELLDQLLQYWRDLMVVHCGGNDARDLSVPARHRPALSRQAASLKLDTILAGLELLGNAKNRLRSSSQVRVWMELALVRLARLEDLVPLSALAELLAGPAANSPPRPAASPAPRPVAAPLLRPAGNPLPADPLRTSGPASKGPARVRLDAETLSEVWPQIVQMLPPSLAADLKAASPAISGPNSLEICFSPDYNGKAYYNHFQDLEGGKKLADLLRSMTDHQWTVKATVAATSDNDRSSNAQSPDNPGTRYRQVREDQALKNELARRVKDVLKASVITVDEGFGAAAPDSDTRQADSEELEEA